jgi:hypothetical protein
MAFDMDRVAHGERTVGDFEGRHPNLAEIVRDSADLLLRHVKTLLSTSRELRVTAVQVHPSAAVTTNPAIELK